MAFVRKKRGQVLVVHNTRGAGGKVEQVVLYSFGSPDEIMDVVVPEQWSEWCDEMTWKYPDYSWDWKRLKLRLKEHLEEWRMSPSGAVVRRERKVRQLAEGIDKILRELSSARPADAVILDSNQGVLTRLRESLDRHLTPSSGLGVLVETDGEELSAGERREADRLFDDGMEHWWSGDRVTACRWFRKALKLHHGHADAHNHLGIYYFDKGRIKEAQRRFQAAVETGSQNLEQEVDLVPWGHMENRPYLRGLNNVALVRHRQKRYAEEVKIYERLLRINPNDNQGIRWLIGEGYHRLGRIEDAIRAYEKVLEEPGCCYSLALALHESGEEPRAGLALVRGFARNRYVAPMLLGERWEPDGGSPFANMEEPEWASDYVKRQGDLWRRVPGSAAFLRRWWQAAPVREWLHEMENLSMELDGLVPGDRRSLLVHRLRGLQSEGNLKLVASEVDPEVGGKIIPHRRPHVASPEEVRVSRESEYAVIEYVDETVGGVHLKLDDVDTLTDQEIIEAHNAIIEGMEEMRAEYEHVAVEIPPGRPQIEFHPESEQWTPRGGVLRCVIHDRDLDAQVVIDDRELSMAEFGRMLTTYAGWGMRIVFVPDDELFEQPAIEVKEPDQE